MNNNNFNQDNAPIWGSELDDHKTVLADSAEKPHDKKFNKGAAVAAGVGAAAVAGVGTAAAMNAFTDKPSVDDEAPVTEENNEEEIIIGDDIFNPATPGNTVFSSILNPGHAPAAHEPQQPAATSNTQVNNQSHTGNEEPQPVHVNPDEVLAVTAIDESDNDMPELLSFESVELVPDENGEVTVEAQFTMNNESFTMVDIDGDGVFDNYVNEMGNNQGSAAGMMVSDIELMQHENDNTYLAANNFDNNSEISGTYESSVDDTIIV